MTVGVEVAGRTHTGLVRARNEDGLYLGRSLVAVADGLGGHVAGDIASSVAIDVLRSHDRPVGPADLAVAAGQAVRAVNQALRRRFTAEPELAGMATTLVALWWSGSAAVVVNLGDSRAYLLRDPGADRSRLSRITEDHTYRHLVAGADDVPRLPDRLARFLDGRPDGRSPDIVPRALRPGDRFLLCSDGLSSCVPAEQIAGVLNGYGDVGEAADRLVDLAVDHGGPDNITVIVLQVTGAQDHR